MILTPTCNFSKNLEFWRKLYYTESMSRFSLISKEEKEKMKKIAIVLAVMVLLSLCGCCVSVFEEEPTFLAKDLPKELSSKRYSNTIECSVTIEDATFSYKDRGSLLSGLTITVYGTVTCVNNSSSYRSNQFAYKICDSNGYIVEKGVFSLRDYAEGDKFKEEFTCYFDAEPGETYAVEFCEKT